MAYLKQLTPHLQLDLYIEKFDILVEDLNKTDFLIKRNKNEYEVIIGLEVHAQVLSQSKLFSTFIFAFKPIPVLTACFTQNSFITGSIPGNAASTILT